LTRLRKNPQPRRDPDWDPSEQLKAKVHHLAWRWSMGRYEVIDDLYQEGLLAIWLKGETQAPINHQLRTAQNRMLSVRKLGRSVDGKLDRRYRRPRPWLMVSLDRMSGHIASPSRIEEHVVDRLTVLEMMSLLDPPQRRCLALLYQGFTLAEVAGQLQKPRAEVDEIVSDIREQLISWQRRDLEERVS
jgi:DNA-directed RNA polymerase specialized sigma24 family protein